MTPKPGILLAYNGPAERQWIDVLRESVHDRQVISSAELESQDHINYVIAWHAKAEWLNALRNLKVIFSVGAGVDHLLHQDLDPRIPIVRMVADDLTSRMVEYVVWQVLHHHRQADLYAEQQAGKIWQELPQSSARDVSVGIMGFGVLGRACARILTQIGYRVSGWSRTQKQSDYAQCYAGPEQLDVFLRDTEILVVLLPLTGETLGCINYKLLSKLSHSGSGAGPVVINAGRGALQSSQDILRALRDKTLYAASLDVFEIEPLPPESLLWNHPRVSITPHVAATSDPRSLVPRILEQISNFEKNNSLNNVVDRDAGY